MKIVFFGSTDFSVYSLKKLIECGHEVLAVVCQPDKPNARGNKIEVSNVKKFSLEQGIPVYQFQKVRQEGVEILKSLAPELMVVVAYGQILSQEIIDIPTRGIINVHGSLLPKYRGASPIASAILSGEKMTGVTIMRVEKGVDSGAMLLKGEIEIKDNETTGELSERLADLGANLLQEVIVKIQDGTIVEELQDESEATFTKMIQKEDAKIDFTKNAQLIVNQVRAYNPAPIAYFEYKEEKIKIYEANIVEDLDGNLGEILKSSIKEGLIIKCKEGCVSIKKLQAPNGKVLDIKSFLNGKMFEVGYQIK